jgi:hypothetical protein
MLFIGTALYDNRVPVEYLHGLMQTANVLNSHGLVMEYAFERGTYIAINREKLVRRFMNTDCQFFLFIDADSVFTPQDVLGLLSSLSLTVNVVSGLYSYRAKTDKIVKHCFRDLNAEPIDLSEEAPELQECSFVPTGMLMIQRNVFEQLYAKHEFIFDQGFKGTDYNKALWNNDGDEIMRRFEGEDINFCRIWREMGGKVFANTSVKIGHLGEYVYRVTDK